MTKYYDSRELDFVQHDMTEVLLEAEDKLREAGVPKPELVIAHMASVYALACISDCPYTYGARLSELRDIKDKIDRTYKLYQREADKEQRESNVVYVDFNKEREI